MLGKRKGFGETAMKPNNIGYTLIGAAMLWVGWFGFHAGSELAAEGGAGSAMMVTQIATAADRKSGVHGRRAQVRVETGGSSIQNKTTNKNKKKKNMNRDK